MMMMMMDDDDNDTFQHLKERFVYFSCELRFEYFNAVKCR